MEALLAQNLQCNLPVQRVVLNQQQAFAMTIKRIMPVEKEICTFRLLLTDGCHQRVSQVGHEHGLGAESLLAWDKRPL